MTYVDNIQYYTRYLELNSLSLQRENENLLENNTETSKNTDWEGSGPSSL